MATSRQTSRLEYRFSGWMSQVCIQSTIVVFTFLLFFVQKNNLFVFVFYCTANRYNFFVRGWSAPNTLRFRVACSDSFKGLIEFAFVRVDVSYVFSSLESWPRAGSPGCIRGSWFLEQTCRLQGLGLICLGPRRCQPCSLESRARAGGCRHLGCGS